jgi:hypothetical protein
VPREDPRTVLDLTDHDFHDIVNVISHIFKLEVQLFDGYVFKFVCRNLDFLKQDLREKHSLLNASSAKELFGRVWHVLFACSKSPLTTSVCVLTRQSIPIDLPWDRKVVPHFTHFPTFY